MKSVTLAGSSPRVLADIETTCGMARQYERSLHAYLVECPGHVSIDIYWCEICN